MKNSDYTGNLRAIASDFDALGQRLFNLANTLDEQPRYDPKNELYSFVRIAERNTVQLRNMAARTMWGNMTPFYEELASVLGISIVEQAKWLIITVPAILPNRSSRDNSEYITRPLRNCLIQFQREHPIERFQQCAICIVHGYDAALDLKRVRDYDNIETKRYLDVIESVLLTNDSGLLCTVLQTTEIMERDCTQFYLMQPETLRQWAEEHVRSRPADIGGRWQ